MNGYCTCGVQLVEGARFCHKCGRPADGIEPVAEEPQVPPAPEIVAQVVQPTAVPPPLPVVGFQNSASVRSALSAAGIMFLPSVAVMSISGVPFFILLALLLTGLLGVVLYVRRTGQPITLIEGARQGWISGLFFFLIMLILMTLMFLVVSSNSELIPIMREQIKAQGNLTPETSKMLEQMQQPGLFAGSILAAMLLSFVLFTSMSSLGGLLGSRLIGSNSARREN